MSQCTAKLRSERLRLAWGHLVVLWDAARLRAALRVRRVLQLQGGQLHA